MRKITEQAANFFIHSTRWSSGNTAIVQESDNTVVMQLHGNPIAKFIIHDPLDSSKDEIQVTDAVWKTQTTKERLNGIPGVSICQKKGKWFLNGKEWDGKWTTI